MGELKRGRTPPGARICESRVISEWRVEECRAKETSRCERRDERSEGMDRRERDERRRAERDTWCVVCVLFSFSNTQQGHLSMTSTIVIVCAKRIYVLN